MKVIGLILGHIGRGTGDMGAEADLDGDGSVSAREREGLLVPRYVLGCAEYLTDCGHQVVLLGHGSYDSRIRAAADMGADVVVNAHLNSGGGNYGAVFCDYRSAGGWKLAGRVREQMKLLPGLGDFRAIQAYDDRGVVADPWLYRAYGCISGCYSVKPVGIVLEPCFIDYIGHRQHLDSCGLQRMGVQLGIGIQAYLSL